MVGGVRLIKTIKLSKRIYNTSIVIFPCSYVSFYRGYPVENFISGNGYIGSIKISYWDLQKKRNLAKFAILEFDPKNTSI
jgi:hypothetical protein